MKTKIVIECLRFLVHQMAGNLVDMLLTDPISIFGCKQKIKQKGINPTMKTKPIMISFSAFILHLLELKILN